MRLRTLQRWMGTAIFRDLTEAGGIQPRWGDGRKSSEVVAVRILPNARMAPVERLEVYNQQYWYRLLEALTEDFPGLKALLGDRAFDRLCRDYLLAHPSRSWTLRNLGERLPGFIRGRTRGIPRAALAEDMARFEWAKVVAFDAESLPPASPESLASADPSCLRMKLQPHLSLLALRYGVDQWKPRKPKPRRQRVFLAVHRAEETVYHKRLEPEPFRVLSALRDGATLAEACARVPRGRMGEVGGWFQGWGRLRWFARAVAQ